MTEVLRILLLEDNPDDAELNEQALRAAGLTFTTQRVEDEAGFVAALSEFNPDVVLADFNLPDFDGLLALAILRQGNNNLPFIFVTGAMGEELAVHSLHQGANDYILKDRLQRLPDAVLRALKEAVQKRQIDFLVNHDVLTQLPNRNLFIDRMSQAILTAKRYHRSLAVMWIDLSRFHVLNDAYGHQAGDFTLQEVGRRLHALAREGDTLARLSGDQFGMLMANLAHQEDAINLASRVIAATSKPVYFENSEIGPGVCLGISLFPINGGHPEELLKAADIALQRSKKAGRNTFRFYDTGMDSGIDRRLRLESDLRFALPEGQIAMHYQPQVELATGRVNGVEALMRWNHPVMGPISPVEFIPIAEECGLIHSLGIWALKEACLQSRRWQDAGLSPLTMAVNLSVRQFHDPELVDMIAAVLAESKIDPHQLELELTESAFIGDIQMAADIIKRIKALGVQLALDDFGTGYSSLAYLSGFPFDKIKIDQSFVRDIIENPVNAAIATATIAMARSLNLIVLAEGVETDAQMSFLRNRQCEAMQGHLFSRAMPPDQLIQLLGSGRGVNIGIEATEPTLLLVDDEPNILSALRRVLRRDGYRILTAVSPAEGFELLAKNPVQVIISDQRMPGMTGTEFLARVKQLYPETIRIVLSGYTDLESVTDAINRGAIYRFLTKPWDDEALRTTVREAFRVVQGLANA